jgi:preprotein translocase subunit SecB
MAKKKKEETPAETPETAAPEAGNGQMPSMSVLAQYTKDASFENPNAPESMRAGLAAPQININIEIGRQMMENNTVEVVLMLSAKADRDGAPVFICELEYAGLFSINNANDELMQAMILVECPRMLFPFARQIMAELTQNGGYPPILLDPPDFAAMFRDEMMRRQGEAGDKLVN